MGPIGLLGSHRQPTRHPSKFIAAAQPAKHARGLTIGELLVGGQGFPLCQPSVRQIRLLNR
jgi:hypothetical protein